MSRRESRGNVADEKGVIAKPLIRSKTGAGPSPPKLSPDNSGVAEPGLTRESHIIKALAPKADNRKFHRVNNAMEEKSHEHVDIATQTTKMEDYKDVIAADLFRFPEAAGNNHRNERDLKDGNMAAEEDEGPHLGSLHVSVDDVQIARGP